MDWAAQVFKLTFSLTNFFCEFKPISWYGDKLEIKSDQILLDNRVVAQLVHEHEIGKKFWFLKEYRSWHDNVNVEVIGNAKNVRGNSK